jgi:hypothetical protein
MLFCGALHMLIRQVSSKKRDNYRVSLITFLSSNKPAHKILFGRKKPQNRKIINRRIEPYYQSD